LKLSRYIEQYEYIYPDIYLDIIHARMAIGRITANLDPFQIAGGDSKEEDKAGDMEYS
jgi:hypothetical protein